VPAGMSRPALAVGRFVPQRDLNKSPFALSTGTMKTGRCLDFRFSCASIWRVFPDLLLARHPNSIKMPIREKAQIMTATEMERALSRLAHEIVERNRGTKNLALIGIRRRGVPLADRLAKVILEFERERVPVGYLDINLYRDDLSTVSTQPVIQSTEIHFPITDLSVVLVDDVLYTGRTVRAAMDALLDYGRPKFIQLCVLIDRGHRELPIEANYVGKSVQTADNEIIEVKLTEVDQNECVLLVEKV
jgi:pyrimidine operon attenuation protein / uracil phosphoribosyltransferase